MGPIIFHFGACHRQFGNFDEDRESAAKNELMYLIDNMRLPEAP